MTDYLVINGTASQLNNVNAGGTDVPAGQGVTATLTDTELGVLARTTNVIVSKDTDTLNAVGPVWYDYPDAEVLVVNPTNAVSSSLDDDVPAYGSVTTTVGLNSLSFIRDDGLVLVGDLDDEEKRKAAKIITHGTMPDRVTGPPAV